MNLEERINVDYLKAFKERNVISKSLLSTIKGEIQTLKKNKMVDSLSDEDVVKILTKFSKGLKETILVSNDEGSKLELELVSEYLPKEMSREEISKRLDILISNGISNVGLIMKEFVNLPVDRKLVSELIKEKL